MNYQDGNIDGFIAKNERLLDALMKDSIQSVIEEAQTPTSKGGNMRVDTSFLRNSGAAGIGSMPQGESEKPKGYSQDYDDSVTVLTINKLDLGQDFYYGWAANYANYRESQDGFVRLAAQNWPSIVEQSSRRLKALIK